jgi:hypothetical protein
MMDPSKKRGFDEQWKEAFENASVTPPASAWDAIEARLDHMNAEQAFDNQWKNTFDDASVAPPPQLWGQIEARLDAEENHKIVPLWWQSPRMWFAAASIAALLLVGVGVWYNKSADHQQPIAVATTPSRDGKPPISHQEPDARILAQAPAETKPADTRHLPVPTERSGSNLTKQDELGKTNKTVLTGQKGTELIASAKAPSRRDQLMEKNRKSADRLTPHPVKDVDNPDEPITDVAQSSIALTRDTNSSYEPNEAVGGISRPGQTELLASLPAKDLDVYVQKRYVFFKNDQDIEAPATTKHKEYWAGVGLMPASFNPDVNVKTSPSSFSSQSFAKQKSVTGRNAPGMSYAVQTQGGMRLSKHWSVETGVSFLQGNANYEGGGYLMDAATNGFSNVLETALADAYANNGKSSLQGIYPSMSNNSIYIDVTKQVRNDYKFVQLPVQAGFTLNPDGKLSYAVLGGMLANVFVNNELESANGNVIRTTASDDVYRGLNWAATTGLRLNYRLSPKWRATLTGSYQKAITSGFRANQTLESHPYLYGVSWGMRYSF